MVVPNVEWNQVGDADDYSIDQPIDYLLRSDPINVSMEDVWKKTTVRQQGPGGNTTVRP